MRSSPMRAAAYRFRATFGQRWGDYLTLIVLVGLLGGVAWAPSPAPGEPSRRTSHILGLHPSDLQIFTTFANSSIGGSVGYDPATNAKILRLPFVHSMDTIVGFDGNLDFVHGEHLRINPVRSHPSSKAPQVANTRLRTRPTS